MKQKKSGPAIFMYSVIAFMVAVSAVSFTVYYSAVKNDIILWCGIVSFMIVYHFWLRLIMGNVTKLFKNN